MRTETAASHHALQTTEACMLAFNPSPDSISRRRSKGRRAHNPPILLHLFFFFPLAAFAVHLGIRREEFRQHK